MVMPSFAAVQIDKANAARNAGEATSLKTLVALSHNAYALYEIYVYAFSEGKVTQGKVNQAKADARALKQELWRRLNQVEALVKG